MTTTTSNYIPGMCNINPREVARRRYSGHAGLVLTIVLVVIFLIIDVNPWFRLTIIAPAFLSASGYLQARNKFCVAYASTNQHHADDGSLIDITEKSALAADKKKARKINLQAFSIATIVTITSLLIPSF